MRLPLLCVRGCFRCNGPAIDPGTDQEWDKRQRCDQSGQKKRCPASLEGVTVWQIGEVFQRLRHQNRTEDERERHHA